MESIIEQIMLMLNKKVNYRTLTINLNLFYIMRTQMMPYIKIYFSILFVDTNKDTGLVSPLFCLE